MPRDGARWSTKSLRQNRYFPNEIKLIWPVQSSGEKHFASVVGQISDLNSRVSPE
jgi:hypothetical protein